MCACARVPARVASQEEEEGSDDDHPKEQNPRQQSVSSEGPLPPPTLETASDTPLVSPLEEVKCLQPQIVTMATLHEASR